MTSRPPELVWVNEYPGGSLLAYPTKEQADKAAYPERVGEAKPYRKVENAAHDKQ